MKALHHVSLSVTDLDRSVDWYRRVFELDDVLHERGDEREARVFRFRHSKLMLGLVQHRVNDARPFAPSTTGLDHVAFDVSDRQELDWWVDHLDASGVAHSGVIDIPIGGILNFTDPDGIQLALFWEKASPG